MGCTQFCESTILAVYTCDKQTLVEQTPVKNKHIDMNKIIRAKNWPKRCLKTRLNYVVNTQ
ncbi:hypothetical protein FMO003_35480 [Moritella sp. F3]|nr:hypothetical protein FMO001_20720 [Moritella sp. F1]GIC83268.1 hypothetical protein FMO003_35480 [Moritella sp. F3]